MQVIFLRDQGDHPRVQVRMDITKEIIGQLYTACRRGLERGNVTSGPDVVTS